MQEIAINVQHGGFSLSPLGVKRLAELKGLPCFLFKSYGDEKYTNAISPEEIGDSWFSAFTVPNPLEVAGSDQENWHNMSLEEHQASNKRWEEISLEESPKDRNCPLLIQVIKELGEKSWGSHAKLKIVEIPDGVEWEIDEYDGLEWVAEKHRTWN